MNMSPERGTAQGETVTVEFESRAIHKLQAAARHFSENETNAGTWLEAHRPLMAPTRVSSQTPTLVEVFLPPSYSPPTDEWESRFVDGVHNLRTALDALAFELCYLEGEAPTNERAIYFPVVPAMGTIAEQNQKWNERTKKLRKSIPRPLLERVRAVQDWNAPPTSTSSFLSVLSMIDNDDKHRFGVEVSTTPGDITSAAQYPISMEATENAFDRPWIRAEVNELIPAASFLLDVTDQIVPLISVRGFYGPLFALQRRLFDDTYRCIRYICNGVWPLARGMDDELSPQSLLVDISFPNTRRLAAEQHLV